MSSDHDPRPARRGAGPVAAVLLAIAVLAVVEAPIIEFTTSSNYRVLVQKPGHSVPELAETAGATVQERFGLWTAMRELAPGVVLVQPSSVVDLTENARGLGTAERVVIADYDPRVGDELATSILAMAVSTGTNRELRRQYALTLGADPQTLMIVEGADHRLVVDVSVLTELGVGPRRFGLDPTSLSSVESS